MFPAFLNSTSTRHFSAGWFFSSGSAWSSTPEALQSKTPPNTFGGFFALYSLFCQKCRNALKQAVSGIFSCATARKSLNRVVSAQASCSYKGALILSELRIPSIPCRSRPENGLLQVQCPGHSPGHGQRIPSFQAITTS